MATKKKDFSSAFGITENQDDSVEVKEAVVEEQKTTPEESVTIVEKNTNSPNVVVTYSDPMQELERKYLKILDLSEQEKNGGLTGFLKRTQSDIYANTTIQVRRDLYGCICEYISDMGMTKSKVLNEIFMLGVNEFIKKYSVNK